MKKSLSIASLLILPLMFVSVLQGCSKKPSAPAGNGGEKVAEIENLWSFDSGSGISSSPVIVGDNIIFASNNNKLYAVDLNTHEEKWSFAGDSQSNNIPIVDGNTVIYTTKDTCYAIDATTGKEIWNFKGNVVITDGINGYDYHLPSPILYKDLVIFPTIGAKFYALNKTDGSKVWEYEDSDSGDIRTTPAIDGNIMVYGDVKGNAFAMDLDTQKTLWTKSIGKDVIHSVAAYKGFAYFSGRDCTTVAFDIKDGSSKWRYSDNMGSWLTGEMIVKDDIIYVPGSDNLKTMALKYDTGEIDTTYVSKANIFSRPTVDENNIMYITDGNVYTSAVGHIIGYDLNTKQRVLEGKFDKPIYSSPAVRDGIIYFGCTDGKLYAVKAKAE